MQYHATGYILEAPELGTPRYNGQNVGSQWCLLKRGSTVSPWLVVINFITIIHIAVGCITKQVSINLHPGYRQTDIHKTQTKTSSLCLHNYMPLRGWGVYNQNCDCFESNSFPSSLFKGNFIIHCHCVYLELLNRQIVFASKELKY